MAKTINTLNIAAGLALPLDTATSRDAIFGISGSGKTYTALVLVEELQASGIPYVVIDPLGVTWGLRVPIDESATFGNLAAPVYIFGGEHQDLPLDPGQGAAIATMIVERNLSAILDLSGFDDDDARAAFVAEFARELLRINRTPRKVVIDEADIFAAQAPDTKAEFASGKAIDNLVRRGRVHGLGVALVSQRPAIVKKNILTQITLLIVHQLTGRADLDAINGWIKDHGSDEQRRTVLQSLPGLSAGQAWVWRPSSGLCEQVQIRRRWSFDSSATPEIGAEIVEPARLNPPDLEALRDQLGAAVLQAEQSDPDALRKRVADLERQLKNRPAQIVQVPIEVPVLTPDALQQVRLLQDLAAGLGKELPNLLGLLGELIRQYGGYRSLPMPADLPVPRPEAPEGDDIPRGMYGVSGEMVEAAAAVAAAAEETAPTPIEEDLPEEEAEEADQIDQVEATPGADGLTRAERKILTALADLRALGLESVIRANAGAFAGMSASGGAFSRSVAGMLESGLLSSPRRGEIAITPLGLGRIGPARSIRTLGELHAAWKQRVGNPQARMLDMLIAVYPQAMSREDLARAVGMAAAGGAFARAVRSLIEIGAARYPGRGFVVATDLLFPPGLN